MSDDHDTNDVEIGINAEAKIYASIVRYLAERLSDTEPDVEPSNLVQTGELFCELADAFDQNGGFEFVADQALILTHAFSMIEGGMRILAEQAHESGHTNAAAKMEWAALKTRTMTAKLETYHLEGASGIITLLESDDDGDLEAPATIDPDTIEAMGDA